MVKDKMPRHRPFLLLGAMALAFLAQWTLAGKQLLTDAACLFAIAIVLMTVAIAKAPSPRLEEGQGEEPTPSLRPFKPWQWLGAVMIGIGLIGMWRAAQALAGPSLFQPLDKVAPTFLLSLALTTAGILLWERWSLRTSLIQISQHRVEYLLLLGILALALYLRLYQLDYYPPPNGISWVDEAQIGKDAHLILTSGAYPWQYPLLTYPTALAFSIFGENTYALRLVPDLWGFLTVLVFYFLARELFSVPAALAATFLFAVSRWHLALTRMPFPVTTSTFLSVAIFFLVIRGLRTRGAVNFLWAGLLIGIGYYDYAAFKILPVFILVLLVTRWLQGAWAYVQSINWRQRLLKFAQRLFHVDGRMAFCLCLFGLGTAISLLPFVALVRRSPAIVLTERFSSSLPLLFGPSAGIASLSSPEVTRNLQRLLLLFNYKGESWPAFNIPNAPMLDPITAVLLVLALGYCTLTFWRKDHLVLLTWFSGILLGGGLFAGIFQTHRLAMAIPVVFLIIASLIEQIQRSTTGQRPEPASNPSVSILSCPKDVIARRPLIALILFLILAAVINYDLFFNHQIHRQDVRIEYDSDTATVASAIANLSGKPYVYLFADWPFYTETHDFGWMAGVPKGRSATIIADVLPAQDDPTADVAYVFVSPYDVDTLTEAVRDVYPQARTEKMKGPIRDYVFTIVQVSQAERDSPRPPSGGLRVSYFDSTNPTQVITQHVEPVIAFTGVPAIWRSAPSEALQGKKYAIQWDGKLKITQTGLYRFKIETWSGSTELALDGQTVLQELGRANERITREAQLNLGPGTHDFRLSYTFISGEFAGLKIRWIGPDGVEQVMPPGVFTPN
jgi:hypothetical protein